MTPWIWLAQEVGQGLYFRTVWPGEIREQEKASQSEVFVGSLRMLSVMLIEVLWFSACSLLCES